MFRVEYVGLGLIVLGVFVEEVRRATPLTRPRSLSVWLGNE